MSLTERDIAGQLRGTAKGFESNRYSGMRLDHKQHIIQMLRDGSDEIDRLKARITELEGTLSKLCGAVNQIEEGMRTTGGCTDGYCVIDPPKGMHTNGGCNCHRDRYRAATALARYRHFYTDVKAVLQPDTEG